MNTYTLIYKSIFLTDPSMNIIGHMILEMVPFSLAGSALFLIPTVGKIVGIRLMKRPAATTIALNSFKEVGFLRKIRNL